MKKLLFQILARKSFQSIFEWLHRLSLIGMNYGNGGSIEESGEVHLLNSISGKLRQNPVVIDAGANTGQFLAYAHQLFPAGTTFHCFEPLPHCCRQLNASFKDKIEQGMIYINQAALGKEIDDRPLYFRHQYDQEASFSPLKFDHHSMHLHQSEVVQVTTIDQYCKDHHIDFIDFLKIDVEGHEWEVLKGGQNMLANQKIASIQFEFGKPDIYSGTYMFDFFNLLDQYDIYRVLTSGLKKMHYNERYEIFRVTNYFCKLR